MSNPPNTVVDSLFRAEQDQTVHALLELTHPDGSVYDLTGKTVTATIRARRQYGNVLNAAYEDIAVTIPSDETTAANGGAMFDFIPLSTYFFAPPQPEASEDYYIRAFVETDNAPCQLILFGVRRKP